MAEEANGGDVRAVQASAVEAGLDGRAVRHPLIPTVDSAVPPMKSDSPLPGFTARKPKLHHTVYFTKMDPF